MRSSYLFAVFAGVELFVNADSSSGLRQVEDTASDASATEHIPKELPRDHATIDAEQEDRMWNGEAVVIVVTYGTKRAMNEAEHQVANILHDQRQLIYSILDDMRRFEDVLRLAKQDFSVQ